MWTLDGLTEGFRHLYVHETDDTKVRATARLLVAELVRFLNEDERKMALEGTPGLTLWPQLETLLGPVIPRATLEAFGRGEVDFPILVIHDRLVWELASNLMVLGLKHARKTSLQGAPLSVPPAPVGQAASPPEERTSPPAPVVQGTLLSAVPRRRPSEFDIDVLEAPAERYARLHKELFADLPELASLGLDQTGGPTSASRRTTDRFAVPHALVRLLQARKDHPFLWPQLMTMFLKHAREADVDTLVGGLALHPRVRAKGGRAELDALVRVDLAHTSAQAWPPLAYRRVAVLQATGLCVLRMMDIHKTSLSQWRDIMQAGTALLTHTDWEEWTARAQTDTVTLGRWMSHGDDGLKPPALKQNRVKQELRLILRSKVQTAAWEW